MILRIDLTSSEPLYRQIRTQVVQGVASGELAPGDPLPSVRSLASDLGVNMHTVNKAYAVLRDEGYVTIRLHCRRRSRRYHRTRAGAHGPNKHGARTTRD